MRFLLFSTFLIFLTLKLCDVITWSWVWVTAPLWIPLGIYAVFVLTFLFAFGLGSIIFGALALSTEAEEKLKEKIKKRRRL